MYLEYMWKEIKRFIDRQSFFCIKDHARNDGSLCFNGEPESSVIKFFQRFLAPIARTLRVNTHMHSFCKDSFHFFKASATAGVTIPIHQHRPFAVIPSK